MRTQSAAVLFLVAASVASPFRAAEPKTAPESIAVSARVRVRPSARILAPQLLVITAEDLAAGRVDVPLEIEIRGEGPFLALLALAHADGVESIEAVDGRAAAPAGAWLICHPPAARASDRIHVRVRVRLAPAAAPVQAPLPFRVAVRTLG